MKTRTPSLLLSCIGLLVLPSTVQAATYNVPVCGVTASGANHSWTYSSSASAALESGATCAPERTEYSGLWVRDIVPTATSFEDGQAGDWVFTAPAGLNIAGITYKRWLYKQGDNDLQPSLRTADGTILDGCALGSPTFQCSVGATGGGGTATFSGLSTPSLRFGVRCATGGGGVVCATGGTIHHARAAMYEAAVTITDNVAPSLGGVTGSLLAGGWLRGTHSAGASATDASGIRRERVLLIDSVPQEIGTAALSCDYTYARPCTDAGSTPPVSIATNALSDGPHQIRIAAQDAAGNETLTAPVTIQTDNTAPTAPSGLTIAEGTSSAAANLTASWTNPGSQAAPITGARWSICTTAGGNCQTGDVTGSTAVIPAPEGLRRVKVWLQDAAGNTDPATAASTDVIVDRTAPAPPLGMTATVAPGPGPRTVTTGWTNPDGQVAPITVAYWSICPAGGSSCDTGDVASSPLTRTLEAGTYTIKVWLQDATGNTSPATAATTTVTVPASTGSGSTARRASGLTVSRVLRGRRLTVTARLAKAARGPVTLQVVGRRGTRKVLTRARTVQTYGNALRWTLTIPRSVTRLSVTARYAGDANYRPLTRARSLSLARQP